MPAVIEDIQSSADAVLFSDMDRGWGRPMPVRLITYVDGTMDVHRQTGPDFDAALTKARFLLSARGMSIGAPEAIGSSGVYCPVTRVPPA